MWSFALWIAGSGAAAAGERSERLVAPALERPASIFWDAEDIPHIVAESERDAFVGLGYAHARDRFFQIDLFRHVFAGTLAELFGAPALASDVQYRRFDLRTAARDSLEMLPPGSRALVEAYADGINLFLARGPLPIEYGLLELGPQSIEPWTAEDSLLLLKGFSLGSWLDLDDIERSSALAAYRRRGAELGFDGDALFHQEVFRLAPILPEVTAPRDARGGEAAPERDLGASTLPNAERGRFEPRPETLDLGRRLAAELRRLPLLAASLDGDHGGMGSNWWLVAGEHTESGHPLLANDPHQFLAMPPVLYEVQLLTRRGRPLNVSGVTFAGLPAVVTGCTLTLCYAATNGGLDLTDSFEEEVLFDSASGLPTHTVFRGEAEPLVVLDHVYRANLPGDGVLDSYETLDVAPLEGGKSFHLPRRNGGPLLAVGAPVDGRASGLSVQYTGFSGSLDLEAFFRWQRARTLGEFRRGLRFADGFTFNMAVADVRGNIGFFTTGELPLREDLELLGRADGAAPYLIRDGTGGHLHEWLPATDPRPDRSLGYRVLPLAEMPSAINPPQGYLINANNDPLGTTLDNDALDQRRPGGGVLYFDRSFVSLRAARISALLERALAAGPIGDAAMRRMQADHVLPDAHLLLPPLLDAWERALDADRAAHPRLAEAVERLAGWSGRAPTGIRQGYDPGDDPHDLPAPDALEIDDSVAATLFSVWRGRLLARVIDSTLTDLGLGEHLPPYRQAHVALLHLLRRDAVRTAGSGVDFFAAGAGDAAARDGDAARDAVLLAALVETLELLAGDAFADAFGGSTELADYRWGKLHRIVLAHPFGPPFSVPPAGGFEDLAPELPGLARGGGFATVDTGTHDLRAASDQGFRFRLSPGRRFYAHLDPSGIDAYQILPGGQSGDPTSPGYTLQLGRWLTNRYAPVRVLRRPPRPPMAPPGGAESSRSERVAPRR